MKIISMADRAHAYRAVVKRHWWSRETEEFALLSDDAPSCSDVGWYRTLPKLRRATSGEESSLFEYRRKRTIEEITREGNERRARKDAARLARVREALAGIVPMGEPSEVPRAPAPRKSTGG